MALTDMSLTNGMQCKDIFTAVVETTTELATMTTEQHQLEATFQCQTPAASKRRLVAATEFSTRVMWRFPISSLYMDA